MSTAQPLTEISATSSSDEWRPVDPESLPGDWERYARLLRTAFARSDGSYNERDFLCALLMGQWQLWACGDSAICITEIAQFPRQRKCLIRCIAGDWRSFEGHFDLLEAYARSQGCDRIEAYMRKGLVRKLPPDWTARHVYMVKEL